MNENLSQDTSDFNVMFVHSKLDEIGLDPFEYRVYGHLVRRAGKNGIYPSLSSICEICKLSKPTVIKAINGLEQRGMLSVRRQSNKVNEYILTKPSEWKVVNDVDQSTTLTSKPDLPERSTSFTPGGKPHLHEVYPLKYNQLSKSIASSKEAQEDSKISEDARKLTFELIQFMVRENPKAKFPEKGTEKRKKWELEADRLLRLDEHSKEEASKVLSWAKHDDFWSKNILSTKKFREQYDRLFLAWRQSKGYRPSAPAAAHSQSVLEIRRQQEEFEKQRAQGANVEQSTQT